MTTPIHFVLNRKLNRAEILTGEIFRHWEMVQAAFHVGIRMADGNAADGIGRCKSLAQFQRKAEHGKTTVLEASTIERIESEKPADGVPVPTRSKYELALYAMPNGSHFATLIDGSQETWEAYADDLNRIAMAERAERKRFKPAMAV